MFEHCFLICRKKVVSNVTKSGHHLVVDGLPALARVDDIRSFFGQFGAITKVTLGERMDSALVTFSTAEAVQRAIGAASLRLKGANLRVSLPEDHEYRYEITRLLTSSRHEFREIQDLVSAVKLTLV